MGMASTRREGRLATHEALQVLGRVRPWEWPVPGEKEGWQHMKRCRSWAESGHGNGQYQERRKVGNT